MILDKKRFILISALAFCMTTHAYCVGCKKVFNAKDGFAHVLTTHEHRVHFIDATDPKSREAHASMGLSPAILTFIEKEQNKMAK